MKRWILSIAIVGMTTLGVLAQQRPKEVPSPEERAQQMTNRMAERLNLSEDQKKEVYAIHLENAHKRQKEMEAQRAEREARLAEMKAQDEKIKSILTEEQRKEWEEIKMDARDRRRPGGEVHDRPERPMTRRPRN